MKKLLSTLLLLTISIPASAQTTRGGLGLEEVSDGKTPSSSATPAAIPGAFPITINIKAVNRAGITPNTGYVMVRDLRPVLKANVISGRYVLETSGKRLEFRPSNREAVLNGLPAQLNATPIRLPDTLLFPLAALKLLGCTYQPLTAMSNLRPYEVTCDDDKVILAATTFSNNNPPAGQLLPRMY